MNYQQADSLLQGRCRERRRLENNTYLERCYMNAIAVRLHATNVLTFFPDGRIEIEMGGWHTVTTRDRINRYLSPDNRGWGGWWRVHSERGLTILSGRAGLHPVTLESPAVIHSDGTATGGGDYAEYIRGIREADNERKRLRSRARYWIHKVRGIYVDRSNCKGGRRGFRATGVWRECHTQGWRGRRGLQIGAYDCGCVVYRKPASARGLTVQNILEEDNATVRLAKMNVYGLDRFILDAGAKAIDSEAGYDLFNLVIPNHTWRDEQIRALKMVCPSTGAVYINMVPPHTRNVREGLDFMFSTENYLERVGQQA